MADSIGRIFGSGYSLGGFGLQRKSEEAPQEKQAEAPVVREEKQVDPQKVFEFMNQYNVFVPEKTNEIKGVDKETEARISGYMERFENIYGVVEKEFGPNLAPEVMNLVMDKIMGM